MKQVQQAPLALQRAKPVPQVPQVPLALQRALRAILGLLGWVLQVQQGSEPQDRQEPLTAPQVSLVQPVTWDRLVSKEHPVCPACPVPQEQLMDLLALLALLE